MGQGPALATIMPAAEEYSIPQGGADCVVLRRCIGVGAAGYVTRRCDWRTAAHVFKGGVLMQAES